MIYRLYPQSGRQLFTEEYSRCRVPYLSVKRMREMYPDGGFVVIGEIGNFALTQSGQDTLLISDGAEVPIFPRGCMRRPFEWIAGYVGVEKNTYIAVVQNLFFVFLRYRRRKGWDTEPIPIHPSL